MATLESGRSAQRIESSSENRGDGTSEGFGDGGEVVAGKRERKGAMGGRIGELRWRERGKKCFVEVEMDEKRLEIGVERVASEGGRVDPDQIGRGGLQ